ncbi:MAG: hypothetical protein M0Q23_04085 [Syntrophales bacterium]|nr:hypothetical protein [Syntrophales bacterium]MCK9527822.1 hypothetical protein [Syntrophales bacterium]MDX9922081.1 hypothetical protein [Syntrophales bacterium]
MTRRYRKSSLTALVPAGLVLLAGILILTGCGTTSRDIQTLDPYTPDPQVIVNPASVRLGVAKLMDTTIEFQGSGFEPGDSVFVTLSGNEIPEFAVADAPVLDDGTFRTTAGALGKITGMLRATISGTYAKDGSYKQYIVITEPPLPEGIYTVTATSMLSDRSAGTELQVRRPGTMDRIKDWMGKKLGKIKDERPR